MLAGLAGAAGYRTCDHDFLDLMLKIAVRPSP
jgi:hypothetical protein